MCILGVGVCAQHVDKCVCTAGKGMRGSWGVRGTGNLDACRRICGVVNTRTYVWALVFSGMNDFIQLAFNWHLPQVEKRCVRWTQTCQKWGNHHFTYSIWVFGGLSRMVRTQLRTCCIWSVCLARPISTQKKRMANKDSKTDPSMETAYCGQSLI